jgi:acetyltransferase-like isoleucine patch superfamily enzyme
LNGDAAKLLKYMCRPALLWQNRNRIRWFLYMQARYWHSGVRFPLSMDIRGSFYLFKHSEAQISIGEYVTIVNTLAYNPAGVVHPTVLRAAVAGARLVIGNHVGMSGCIICCETSVSIGDHCLLGANCAIYDTDYHPLNYLDRRDNRQSSTRRSPVIIGDDCWIGANAVILKGVCIGPRSIVGANSVVTRDVPADSIVAGNPARVIGKPPCAPC